jgi:hypothetical protein
MEREKRRDVTQTKKSVWEAS